MKKKTRGQAPKSKETLLAEMEMQKEVLRRKTKIKEELYPVLNDTPFFDASNFLSGTQSVIRAIFMDDMRRKKFSEYAMTSTVGSPYPELTTKFLELLKDESVESGLYMLGQVEQAIVAFKENETKDRKVGSYKTNFTI